MKKIQMKKAISFLFFLLVLGLELLTGQSGSTDFMRSIGKIYVVVAVIVTIFIGIVFFLVYLDRKLTKLEDQINEHDQA